MFLPLCLVDERARERAHVDATVTKTKAKGLTNKVNAADTRVEVEVIRHGDATLNTQLPVEAVCGFDGAAYRAERPNVMRVVSIAAVPGYDLRAGTVVVRTTVDYAGRGSGPACEAEEADALVGYLELFAAVHGAAKPAPLRFDYDVFGRRGTLKAGKALSPPVAPTASGSSGFSVQVGGNTYSASVSLWEVSEGCASSTSVLVFDAGGILPDDLARKAISKSAWKRRGGYRYQRRPDGSLTIDKRGTRIARIALYLFPNAIGSSSRFVNAKDGPEALARSAINTAISSIASVSTLAGTCKGHRDGPTVEEAITAMDMALRNMQARRAGGRGGEGGEGGEGGAWGEALRAMLLSS